MNINLAELNFYVCYESKSLPPLDTDSTVNCLLHARLVVPLFGREKKNLYAPFPRALKFIQNGISSFANAWVLVA